MKKLLYIEVSLFPLPQKNSLSYENLDTETQKLVHLSVHIVQALKTITIDTIVDDVIVAILSALNLSETKSAEYLQFASKCWYYLDGVDDGKLDWEDCKASVGEYYDGYVKK